MLIRSFVIMTVVALASHYFACEANAQVVPNLRTSALLAKGEPVTVVCFGDSITGVYYHTGGRRAYPEMLEIALKKAYSKAQVKVINAGISGNTTREALARIDRDVLKYKPQLVTVMFGMNDIVRIPLEDFKKNMVEIKNRCHKAGAEVLFCTQNNVIENAGRPNKKLSEISQVIRDLAKEHNLVVADCHAVYQAAKSGSPADWRLLLSDEIHPNMDGHKLMAETIAGAVLDRKISLKEVGPPSPAIPHTLKKLKAGQSLKVLAMPPYDKVIGPALRVLDPEAKFEVETWKSEGMTLPQIEKSAKRIRGMKVDLVIVAIPPGAEAPDDEGRIHSYSWVLNWSLSFGKQQWDVVAIPPSTAKVKLSREEIFADQFARRLIVAQDLSMITRRQGENDDSLQAVMIRWLKEQAELSK